MQSKDLFSGHSDLYATFRPSYPDELFRFLYQHTSRYRIAWDCATGNGQVAASLASRFRYVCATDISEQQLAHATTKHNIEYLRCAAEKTPFASQQFDLITVGQALHWFNTESFFAEAKRVGRKNALLAAWGYGLCSVSPEIDACVSDFYTNTIGTHWDEARKHVDNRYQDIPFPFKTIDPPPMHIVVNWDLNAFAGYLNTWSAVQHFIQAQGVNPVDELVNVMSPLWGAGEPRRVTFPLFFRVGRIP